MLDDGHTAGRHHDRGHRRQVDRVGAVTAGTDHVHRRRPDDVGGHPARVPKHRVGELLHLRGGGPLHLDRDRESRDLGGRRDPGHDLVHGPPRLSALERASSGQAAQNLRPGHRIGGCHELIITNVVPRVEFDNYKASYFMM